MTMIITILSVVVIVLLVALLLLVSRPMVNQAEIERMAREKAKATAARGFLLHAITPDLTRGASSLSTEDGTIGADSCLRSDGPFPSAGTGSTTP